MNTEERLEEIVSSLKDIIYDEQYTAVEIVREMVCKFFNEELAKESNLPEEEWGVGKLLDEIDHFMNSLDGVKRAD